MIKFKNGERDFKENQFVYVVVFTTMTQIITRGKITYYYGSEQYGILFDYGSFLIFKKDIFTSLDLAKQELNKRICERKYENSLSEKEWVIWDIKKRILNLTEESQKEVLKKIKNIENFEDYEFVVFNGYLRYRHLKGNEKFKDLCVVKYSSNTCATTKKNYTVTCSNRHDADETILLKIHTNDKPNEIFKKYGKDIDTVLTIANKKWTLENGLNMPIRYSNQYVKHNGSDFEAVLGEEYVFNRGSFTILNDEIVRCSISIDRNVSVFFPFKNVFSFYGKSKLEMSERVEKATKKLKSILGNELFDKFQESIL